MDEGGPCAVASRGNSGTGAGNATANHDDVEFTTEDLFASGEDVSAQRAGGADFRGGLRSRLWLRVRSGDREPTDACPGGEAFSAVEGSSWWRAWVVCDRV
jgi:hypothetical protein